MDFKKLINELSNEMGNLKEKMNNADMIEEWELIYDEYRKIDDIREMTKKLMYIKEANKIEVEIMRDRERY